MTSIRTVSLGSWLWWGCGPAPSPSIPASGASSRRVVVLVLDGVRLEESFGEGFSDAVGVETAEILPQIRETLLPKGSLVRGAYASGITITAPGHVDLLTGIRHSFANYPLDSEPGAYLPEYPSLLTVLPSGEALLATDSALVLPLAGSLSPQGEGVAEVLEADTDEDVIALLKARLPGSGYRLVVANLHQADSMGHDGPVSGYGERVLALDAQVMSLWHRLQAAPDWSERTTLVLVADHGRHRDAGVEGWREHGDHCIGCRQIPMVLVGSGISPGVIVDAPYTLEDLGQTLAALLGVEHPYGTGRVMAEVLVEAPGDAMALGAWGPVEPTSTGALLAWSALTGEVQPRSEVVWGDVVVSSPAALAAEAPRGAEGVLCWRELHGGDAAEAIWPWVPVCRLADGQEIGGPTALVWALWRPSLAIVEGSGDILAAWVDNSSGVVVDTASRLTLSRWRAATGAWEEVFAVAEGSFPSHPALVVEAGGETALVAVAVGEDGGNSGRFSRQIRLYRVPLEVPSEAAATPILQITPKGATVAGDVSLAAERLEHPVLWRGVGGEVRLAWVAYTSATAGAEVWQVVQSAGGGAFSAPMRVDEGSGQVLGHVSPVFDGAGRAHWAQWEGTQVLVCGEGVGCMETGSSAIRGMVLHQDQLWGGIAGEGREWRLSSW